MKNIIKKITTYLALLVLFSLPLLSQAATSSSLYQQAADANKKASDLANQADYLSTQIANLNAQITDNQKALDATTSQIADTQAKIEDLKNQIKIQEDNLARENEKMNQIVSAWYMEGDDTSITTALLSSNTLSEVVTKQEYYDSIKQQIEATIEKINQLKVELDKQKAEQDAKMAELSKLQAQQEGYLRSSQYQKSTKATLLSGTNQQKQDYLQQAAKLSAEADRVSAAEEAARRRAGGTTTEGGTGGYPYTQIDVPDPWMFLTRECTSYAAWYWNNVLGKSFYNTRPGQGNANNWPALARDQGYSVSSTPQVNAIISWQLGSYGHVAIVERVYSNGNIDVSEYNWYPYIYTYRSNINPGDWGSYNYIY
jgi:surface antigen